MIITFLLIGGVGCKELFDVKIDATEKIMVVDGLISNDSENYVKLYFAMPFNSTSKNTPIEKAIVTVKDASGKSFQMHENDGGIYNLDTMEFKAKAGEEYKLFITTSEGEQYQSDTQVMEALLPIDSIYGKSMKIPYLEEVDKGDDIVVNRKSIVTFLNILRSDSNAANFRIENSLLIEVYWEPPGPGKTLYGWYLEKIDEHINLTETNKNEKGNDILNFEESTFATEKYHYSIPDTVIIDKFLLIMKMYALNKETYKYYHDINKQISSTGALFDPLTSQLTGNVHCTSNPQKKVFGFFEVSAFKFYTYAIPYYVPDNPNNIVYYKKVNNIGYIPLFRKLLPEKPNFWK